MKKIILTSVLSLIMSVSIFAAPVKPLELEPITIDEIKQQNMYIDVISDPRLEVLGIICRLAGYKGFTNYYVGEATYTTQIDSYFSKYKDDRVVNYAKALKDRGIDDLAMISLAYHIKPDFSGTVIDFSPLPSTLDEKWKKIRTREIHKFITYVHDFVIKTNYSRLLILNRGDLLSNVGYFINDYQRNAICEWADEFFNEDIFDTQVISINKICPLVTSFNYVIDRNGENIAYSTIYPSCTFSDLILTYFSNYVYFLIDPIWDNVKEHYTETLIEFINQFANTPAKEKKDATDDSKKKSFAIFLSSFIALEYFRSDLYLEKHKNDDNYITYEAVYGSLEKGFSSSWFYDLASLMEEYANNRDKYPSFSDFLPRIETVINSIEIPKDNKK